MRVLVAIDSFKGSLSSREAGQAVAEGIRRALGQETPIEIRSLADGGEGTTEALVEGMDGEYRHLTVAGPLMRPVEALYGVVPSEKLGIIEMAASSGITLVSAAERNPLKTTTYGFGQLIRQAIEVDGCRRLILGIGGSATNDGGAGMLQALGFDLLDADGNPIPPGAEGLEALAAIGTEHVLPALQDGSVNISVACDVTNPLCGPRGCSAVFGPQKGAIPAMIQRMDAALARYAELAQRAFPEADANAPGSGAAGGLGFALRAFLKASMSSGVEMILRETRMAEAVAHADIIVTGEGRLDAQTVMGKAPSGIASLAKEHGKKVIAFAGCVTRDARACNEAGIDAFFPVLRTVCTLDEALDKANAAQNVADTAEQVFRLLKN